MGLRWSGLRAREEGQGQDSELESSEFAPISFYLVIHKYHPCKLSHK